MDNYEQFFSQKENVDHYSRDYINEDEKVYLKQLRKKHAVLDVGCSGGRWCFLMSEKAGLVDGIDISKTMIERAKEIRDLKSFNNIAFTRVDILKFISDIKYDFVFATFNLLTYFESKEDRLKALKKLIELTKDGGYTIITLNNRYWWKNLPKVLYYFLRNTFCKFGDVYTGKLFQHLYSEKELRKIFSILQKEHNFTYTIQDVDDFVGADMPRNMSWVVTIKKEI